ncbi:MAG: L,D-transpeptidase [Defluviitaleaceae bacterium]|nr:L,D-transpeptidase [Defluviitaleaceae bacterium]
MITKTLLCACLLLIPATLEYIKEAPIIAEITESCKIYSDKDRNFPIGDLAAGCHAEILEDFSAEVYKINASGALGWVEAEFLNIPPDSPTDKSILTMEQLEDFVAKSSYTSKTDFLILTDIGRQKTHIFKASDPGWSLLKTFDCSTGTNTSPTTRGIFTISERGLWFYSQRLSSGAKYWMRFNGQYLFHSIPMDSNKNIIPGEDIVGEKRSSGCVRLMPNDAKWLYENIPDGSTVVII